jgi:prepilin-type N-terminal cleavage/methylation domain-containing protein
MVVFSFINIKKTTRSIRYKRFNNNGFTLVEMIIVIANLGIFVTLEFHLIWAIIERTKEQACNTNRLQLEKMCYAYLISEDIDYSETVVSRYL